MRSQERAGGPAFVAYYRVSTDRQGRSGLGLDAQRQAVADRVRSAGGRLVDEYTEQESGRLTDRDRPQLHLALASCRARRATLIIAKLDRLARNTLFLLTVVEGSGQGGVTFCDLPNIPPGPVGKFMTTQLASVAELEAGLISERTKAALAAAKARGTKLGNPNILAGDRTAQRAGHRRQRERSQQRAADLLPHIRDAQLTGAKSLREIAAKLTAWGIAPPSGGAQWHASQIRRVLKIGEKHFAGGSG